jgi:hypothetical protein
MNVRKMNFSPLFLALPCHLFTARFASQFDCTSVSASGRETEVNGSVNGNRGEPAERKRRASTSLDEISAEFRAIRARRTCRPSPRSIRSMKELRRKNSLQGTRIESVKLHLEIMFKRSTFNNVSRTVMLPAL